MTGRKKRGRLSSRAAVAVSVASLLITLATITLTGAGASASARHQQGSGGEEFARRQYETGLAFMRDGRYQEALKDFQAVADNYPSSAVADQALLQIAT